MPVNSVGTEGLTLDILDKSASPVTQTTIGGITDMPAINSSKSTNEDTAMDDVNRHYKMGIGEPPSFSLTLYWDPNESPQQALEDAHNNDNELDLLISCPDSPASTYEFKALVTGYSTPYGSVGGLMQQDFTFQLNENDHGDIITPDPTW